MDIRSDKWITRLLNQARVVASYSKDPSTKTGAIIVTQDGDPISNGYNGLPRGLNDDIAERVHPDVKYAFFEHAERNAIYNSEVSLRGAAMFATHFPCVDCMRGILQKRIGLLVVDSANGLNSEFVKTRWERFNFKISYEMLMEAGIEYIEGTIDENPQ